MKKNAIILAAGKSNRFAPFTYEKPKGLFIVRGEVLIERQIEQLIESGIDEIIVVIGYMKEKFFYLEQKFHQVKLVVNNTFGKYGNIYSLFVAKEYLNNTYICCADQYFLHNPFLEDNADNISYRACSFYTKKFREFSIDYTDAKVISGCYIGGSDKMAMIGHAYFNERFSQKFKEFMENEINDFGIANTFWEEFYEKHIKELTLYIKEYENDEILEFDTIDELRKFDSDFLLNVDSEIVSNICNKLDCHPNEIVDISVIQAGLTNVSFKFTVDGTQYVYRHPGGTAGNLIDRRTELYVQYKAKDLGLDKSFIYMDPTGWKLSYYVKDIIPCDFINNEEQLKKGMEYLRRTHTIPCSEEIKIFDNVEEGKKLWKIASATKGNLFKEFEEFLNKIDIVNNYLKLERKKYNIELVVSHNDVYEPNFIATKNGELYLIDWEYAGLMDPANDICSIFTRYEYDDNTINKLINAYYGRNITPLEYRHVMGQSIINAFYWVSWGMYKGSVGEEDGFFFLTSYRYIIKYIDSVIESYRGIEDE